MKSVRLYDIGQNKFGDTSTRFRAQLFSDEQPINVSMMPTVINVANKSGYILSAVAADFQDEYIIIDFNKSAFNQLTPDNYWLEFEVTLEDGDIAKFPTDGGMPFTINQNLKSTTGKLVPTVTFQQVLDAVDAKVDEYVHTIQKGDKGDTGETGATGQNGKDGKDGDVMQSKDNVFTGTNTFGNTIFNKPINGVLETKVITATDYNDIAKSMYDNAGIGIVGGTALANSPIPDVTWYIIQVMPGGAQDSGYIQVYIRGLVYGTGVGNGNIQGWAKLSDDSSVLHNTGNETAAGDKTFTGKTTFTQPINAAVNRRGDLIGNVYIPELLKKSIENSGIWSLSNANIENLADNIWGFVEIVPMGDGSGGIAKVYSGTDYIAIGFSSNGSSISWGKIAKDSTVMHNTGNETASGDKTFTGQVIVQDANPVKVKQSATVEFNSWQGSKMKATRFGNIVALRYSVNPDNDNKITKNQTSAVVIPVGFRPMEPWNMAVGGTVSVGSANVTVNPNGTLTSGWQDAPYAGMMTAMYFTTDPFPSN